MTRDAGSLELAHARISARHGERADEALWRRVEHVRELAAVLDLVRATPLSRWTRGVLPTSDAHAIEAALRREWQASVAAVIDWMPQPHQPAIAWFATWPDLPALVHTACGGTTWPWVVPVVACEDRTASAEEAARLVHGSLARHENVVDAWCREWQRRMPAHTRANPGIAALRSALARERAAATTAGSVLRRRVLGARLRMLLRAVTLTPAIAFVHLALECLEMERLRGELVWRATFPAALIH
jgi:hypothetical protein